MELHTFNWIGARDIVLNGGPNAERDLPNLWSTCKMGELWWAQPGITRIPPKGQFTKCAQPFYEPMGHAKMSSAPSK